MGRLGAAGPEPLGSAAVSRQGAIRTTPRQGRRPRAPFAVAAAAGLLFTLGLVGVAALGVPGDQASPLISRAPARPAINAWPMYGADLAASAAEITLKAAEATPAVSLTAEWRTGADGAVSGEPVSVGGHAYFATWGDSVYCVDVLTGEVDWHTLLEHAKPDDVYGPFPRIQNSPLVAGNTVYVAQSSGVVVALDANLGRILWRSRPVFPSGTPNVLRSSLRLFHGVLYVGIGGLGDVPGEWGGVAAVDAHTGRVLWVTRLAHYTGAGAAVYGTPAIWAAGGLLFATTGNPVINGPQQGAHWSDAIVAIRPSDGQIVWGYQTHPDDLQDLDFIAAPNVFRLPDGRVAVGAGEKDGVYYAVDARTGALLWQRDLRTLGARTFIVATAASGQGLLFVGTEDVPSLGHTWPVNYGQPATGRMAALDPATGRIVWQRSLGAAAPIPPALMGRDLFVADALGGLRVLDALTGHVLWTGALQGRIESASAGISIAGDTVMVPLSEPPAVVGLHVTWPSLLKQRAPGHGNRTGH